MSIIDNFNELAESDRQQFAADFVKKINSESIFSDEVNFKITDVEADEMSGDLMIGISHDGNMSVVRKATWQCSTEDEVNDIPDDPDYEESIFVDTNNSLKTAVAEIDGYKVTIEIDDLDENEVLEVDAEDWSEEDSGIGDYEYFGFKGHDSHPYLEVEGTLTVGCSCYMTLYIEPIK